MRIVLLLFLAFLACPAVSAQQIGVMSYNIRVDFGGDGENNWEFRREFLCDQIVYNNPDFIGLQEARRHQLVYIDSILTQHTYIGRGRDNSENQGEYSAILYNKEKYNLITDATFWLSETPEKVSKGWDAAYERICTYGLFEDKSTKKRFYVFNTHLDHLGEIARSNSAKLILEKINSVNSQKLPVLLTGDFNSKMDSQAYKDISGRLNDARQVSKTKPFGPSGSFSGFKFHEPVTLLIDYIFTSPGNTEVLKFAILSDSKDCRYPSDHFPLLSQILIK